VRVDRTPLLRRAPPEISHDVVEVADVFERVERGGRRNLQREYRRYRGYRSRIRTGVSSRVA